MTPDSPIFAALAGLFGLILGSFATCAGHRLAHGGSLTSPARSYCPGCRNTLSWHENIPLFGWLLLRGRCRHCGVAISLRYPLTELVSGVYAWSAWQTFGPSPHFAVALAFGLLFLVLSLVDLESYLLPDMLTLPGAALALACSILLPPSWTLGIGWRSALLGALAGGGGLWLVAEAYRRLRKVDGLGLGDVKLMLLIGALLGPGAVPLCVFFAACLALPVGLAVIRSRSKDADEDSMLTRLPFGPFLCAAALCHLLAGPIFLNLWLGTPLPPAP